MTYSCTLFSIFYILFNCSSIFPAIFFLFCHILRFMLFLSFTFCSTPFYCFSLLHLFLTLIIKSIISLQLHAFMLSLKYNSFPFLHVSSSIDYVIGITFPFVYLPTLNMCSCFITLHYITCLLKIVTSLPSITI
jgi:hypothetical protein